MYNSIFFNPRDCDAITVIQLVKATAEWHAIHVLSHQNLCDPHPHTSLHTESHILIRKQTLAHTRMIILNRSFTKKSDAVTYNGP